MKMMKEQEFLGWAGGKGLGLDPKYPQAAVLEFRGGGASRFWVVPGEPRRRPYFLASLVDLMGEWETCYVWRHRGSWPDPKRVDARRINDSVELLLLQGLGLPVGTREVVQFAREEREALVALLFCTTVFGWSVGEDLYVVPDHGRQVLKTDHHDVVHASFAEAADVGRWVARMAERGFALPEELPDDTFKRPGWMAGGEG